MPHVIPLEDRVLLFRKFIASEKSALGLTESASASPQSILITVHRWESFQHRKPILFLALNTNHKSLFFFFRLRMVEDSFRQLADIPIQLWKGIIRIKFINLQGLDEAGIDQDGVFKGK